MAVVKSGIQIKDTKKKRIKKIQDKRDNAKIKYIYWSALNKQSSPQCTRKPAYG